MLPHTQTSVGPNSTPLRGARQRVVGTENAAYIEAAAVSLENPLFPAHSWGARSLREISKVLHICEKLNKTQTKSWNKRELEVPDENKAPLFTMEI